MKYSYIVTGLQGSGTSLMMRVLAFGGLSVVYSDKEKKVADDKKKFRLPQDILKTDKPFTDFAGNCIKLSVDKVLEVPEQGAYKIILMLRTPEEIRRSSANEMSDYQQRIGIEQVVQNLKKKKNVELVCVCFRDLISHTEAVLKHLELVGWAFNYKKALEQFQKYSERRNGSS